jgi:oxalate decarboxylase/phosphoglucose isomerase-like protein (cupin superfamily)
MTAEPLELRVDPDAWRRHGGRSSFVFSHRLGGNDLLAVPALAELADRLPADDVETMAADQAAVHADGQPGQVHGERPGDLMRSVADRKAWMSLLRIEQDPQYRNLLERLLDEAREAVGRPAGWNGVEGYVFVSAPAAVTPAHIDHEHNLYFQIRGTKRFTVGSCPSIEEEHRLLERFYSGAYGATAFYPADPVTYVLNPGDGLYVPPAAIHLVENGDEVSTSLSVVFHTPDLDRAAKVYALNADLRRLGLRPRPPGERPRSDIAKAAVVDVWRRARAGRRLSTQGR